MTSKRSKLPACTTPHFMAGFRCFVWTSPAADDMEVILMGPGFPTRTLNRPKSEPLQKCLQRLTLTLSSKKEKSKRKRGAPGPPGTPRSGGAAADVEQGGAEQTASEAARLIGPQGEAVPLDGTNESSWVEGCSLTVGAQVFPVLLNAPRVRLELQTGPLRVGYAIAPFVAGGSGVAEETEYLWRWFRLPQGVMVSHHSATGDTFALQPGVEAVQVGDHRCHTPTTDDVGHRLCVACTPREARAGVVVEGPIFQAVSTTEVFPPLTEEHVLQPLFDRQRPTAEFVSPPHLRVLCYNLLADCYTNTTFAQNTLFSHCALAYLDGVYRRQLQLREIAGYHADVLCLQEVGRVAYQQHFAPLLQDMGYEGVLDTKAGNMTEGSATFWRRERLALVEHRPLVLRELVRRFPPLAMLEEECPAVWTVLTNVSTVAQLTLLQDLSADGRLLAVVNTHLFFHPSAPHIRALQVALILSEVHSALSGRSEAAVLFCGDLNSTPDDRGRGLYDFVGSGAVPASARLWWDGRNFKWGKGEDFFDYLEGDARAAATEEEVQAAMLVSDHFRRDLTHPFPGLRSAYAAVEGQEPPYTNLVPSFCNTLDYIFYHPDHLEATAVLPVPDRAVAVALPSPTFPSDHVALVADLRWRAPT
eukprot:EG_transcript_3451